ncbi:hypothetical protein VTI74DRAFT_3622 [Chaetomium olivicolor]
MDDTQTSVLLAEWTARRNVLEFCRSNDYKPEGCEQAANVSLRPSPRFIGGRDADMDLLQFLQEREQQNVMASTSRCSHGHLYLVPRLSSICNRTYQVYY